MVAIPFPTSSAPGWRPQESAGRLVNCYAEATGEGEGARIKRVRVPGLTSFLTSSESGFRGMAQVSIFGTPTLFAAFNGVFVTGTAAGGALTVVDDLPGSGPVYFAQNFELPNPQKVVVTENGVFQVTAGAVFPYPDGDLSTPDIVNGVTSIDGYFVFTQGIQASRIYASELNSTDVNALSFGQANTKPDRLVRPINFGGRLLIFGRETLEIWIDVAASPFPFQRSVALPVGLIGPDAIAGFEDGWSAGLLWVANDTTVRQLDGYTPTKVSPPDLDRLLARDTDPEALIASVYVVDGHPMWSISGETFTWSYDLSTKKWHERVSFSDAEMIADSFGDSGAPRWRGLQTCRAFDRWLVGDRFSGNILKIDPTNHSEVGKPLVMRLDAAPVKQFPQRIRVARADFDLETGVGVTVGTDPIQTDPVVMISYSDDGGVNWSNPVHRQMGRQAVDKLISVHRTGMTSRHGRQWRLEISDPVYVAVFGGDMSAELRQPGG